MAATERFSKTIALPSFGYCDVTWHGYGKVNFNAIERLQHRAAKFITLKLSGLDTKGLNATLGLEPLINQVIIFILHVMPLYTQFRCCNFTGTIESNGFPSYKSQETVLKLKFP